MESGDLISQVLSKLTGPMKEFQLAVKAIDTNVVQLSKSLEKLSVGFHKVGEETAKAIKNITKIADTSNTVTDNLSSTSKEIHQIGTELLQAGQAANIAGEEMIKTGKAASIAGEALKKTNTDGEKIRGVTGIFSELGKEVSSVAANFFSAKHIVEMGMDAISETAEEVAKAHTEYEQWNTTLVRSYGSTQLAAGALDMLQNYAKEAPYPLDKITDSLIDMRNNGFTPTADQLASIGNVATASGKQFEDVYKAVEAGAQGSYKELGQLGVGIRANKSDTEHLTATFNGHTQIIKNTEDAITDYVVGLGKLPEVHNAAGTAMETLGGKQVEVGNQTKEIYIGLAKIFDGPMKAWEDFKLQVISGLLKFVNWLVANKDGIKSFFIDLSEAIGIATTAYIVYETWQRLSFMWMMRTDIMQALTQAWKKMTIAQWDLNAAMRNNPAGAVILLFTILIELFMLLWNHSEAFRIKIFQIWEVGKAVFLGLVNILWQYGQGLYHFWKGIGELILGVLSAPTDGGAMFKNGLDDISQSMKDFDGIKGMYAKMKADIEIGIKTGEKKGHESFQKSKEENSVITPQTATTGKTDGSTDKTTTATAGSAATAGGNSSRNITVNIKTLGQITIMGTTVNDSMSKVRKIVHEELIAAVRDFEVGINSQ